MTWHNARTLQESLYCSGFPFGPLSVIVNAMGNQTYQKRQKELARLQKQKDKTVRRIQRKTEKVKGGPPLEDDPMTGDRATYEPSL
jgi:hypothetical protein